MQPPRSTAAGAGPGDAADACKLTDLTVPHSAPRTRTACTSGGTTGINQQTGPGGGNTGMAGSCSANGSPSRSAIEVSACITSAGKGATATAGGAAGALNASTANQAASGGSQFQGGTGGCGNNAEGFYECGGGGGGGYFGGCGGAMGGLPTVASIFDAPGGGGGGHVDAIAGNAQLIAASTWQAVATDQAQYIPGIGAGGGSGNINAGNSNSQSRPGGDGLMVVQFNVTQPVTLGKSWSANALPGDAVGLSISGSDVSASTPGQSEAGGATTLATATALGASTITLAEAFASGIASYYSAALACTRTADGTPVTVNGSGGTRTVSVPADSGLACEFTNTRIQRIADLALTKTNSPGNSGDQDDDQVVSGTTTTYTLAISNAGPDPVENATLRDVAGSGLSNCNVVAGSCSTSGTATCPPPTRLNYANLSATAGVAIPLLGAGASLQLQVSCTVD